RHLAKVEVAGSSPVIRSKRKHLFYTSAFIFGLKWFMEMFGIWYIPKAEVNCVLIDYRSGDRVKQK
ncbi:hypothetical protein, partial [Ruminococcus intestinalis]